MPGSSKSHSIPSSPKGHLGTQLAGYLMARSTIQTAVVLASGMGAKTIFAKTFRREATKSLLGALRSTCLKMRIASLDNPNDVSFAKKALKDFADWQDKIVLTNSGINLYYSALEWRHEELGIDLVITPLDGAESLRAGESGSVSAAAAGPHKSFPTTLVGGDGDDKDQVNPAARNRRYFCVAIGGKQMTPEMTAAVNAVVPAGKPVGIPLKAYKGKMLKDVIGKKLNFIDKLIAACPNKKHPIVAYMLEMFPSWQDNIEIRVPHRRRKLQGSSVCAALAAYTDKVHIAIFASREPQVIQAAIAARGLGGRLIAIPLSTLPEATASTKEKEEEKMKIDGDRALGEMHFVTGENAILTVSSVTEICVLGRVRFGAAEESAETETMTVSLRTGKLSHQRETLVLDRTNMRDDDGSEVDAEVLLDRFKKTIHAGENKS